MIIVDMQLVIHPPHPCIPLALNFNWPKFLSRCFRKAYFRCK